MNNAICWNTSKVILLIVSLGFLPFELFSQCPVKISVQDATVCEGETLTLKLLFLTEDDMIDDNNYCTDRIFFDWKLDNMSLGTVFGTTDCGNLTIENFISENIGNYTLSLRHRTAGGLEDCTTEITSPSITFVPTSISLKQTESPNGCSLMLRPNLSTLELDTSLIESYSWIKDIPNTDIDETVSTDKVLEVTEVGKYWLILKYQDCEITSFVKTIGANDITGLSVAISPEGPLEICPNDNSSIKLTANTRGEGNLKWSTGSSETMIEANQVGQYSVTFTSLDGLCSASNTIEIVTSNIPTIESASFSIQENKPSSIQLRTAINGIKLLWEELDTENIMNSNFQQQNDGFDVTITATIENSQAPGGLLYEVIPQSEDCTGKAVEIAINVIPTVETLYIPDLISPNGDGINDTWQIVFPKNDPQNYSITIYNRAGGVVYQRNDMTAQWDASNCADATYYFVITENQSNEIVEKGAVTVIGKD